MSEGDVYVQVLYDFSYINEEGKEVKMREGEELLVIKKSNDDWWQVIRNSEKCPFYAPLCYLSVINRQSDIESLNTNEVVKDVNANFENDVVNETQLNPKLPLEKSSDIIVNDTSYRHEDVEISGTVEPTLYSLSFQNPLCSDISLIDNIGLNLDSEDSNSVKADSLTHEDDQEINESAKKDTSVNEDLATSVCSNVSNYMNALPPKPGPEDVPQRSLQNDWFEYIDNNGRKYYYHSTSGKVTWKPPRRSETISSSTIKQNPFSENSHTIVPKPPPKQLKPKLQKLAHSSTESLDSPTSQCMFTILPPGWMQECDIESGVVYYCNALSKKKWYSSQDENGRTYFYDEDSSESFWELPDLSRSDSQECTSAEGRHDSDTSLDTFSSAPSSISKSEYLVSVDSSPKLRSKKAPKLPVPRQFKTRSMVVPESITVNVTDDEKSSLPCTLGSIVIEGTLNKTKLVENGRRVRKNWATSYVVLTDVFLLFYKDPRSAHPISSTKPEFSIDLNGALIDWCPEKSSRKNVFQISTILGHQLLLQLDDAQEIKDWFCAIQDTIIKLPYSLEHGGAKQDDDENAKNSIKLSRSKSTKPCHCKDGSDDVNLAIPVEKKSKIRDKLRQFFVRRPTMESLREKGIILDEPVFGCCLENLCQREDQPIPKFVIKCIETIEQKELTADGLYRASGNLSQVQKIRFHVNQDDYKCLDEEDDVHVLTGALKMFFREMKEPLFPFHMFDKFLQAIAQPDTQSKMKALRDLVHKLPDCNFHTLKYLLQHLLRVTEFHKQNRMQVQNLAIVFGPTLMWPEEESANIALDMMYQNRIVEFLLLEFKSIFK